MSDSGALSPSPSTPSSAASVSSTFRLSNPSSARHDLPPLLHTPKYTFLHIYRNHLTYLTVLNRETPPLFVVEFLQLIADVFMEYFGVGVSESVIRDNFSTVYQLLDEMIDGGYAATTELNLLKDMITPPSLAHKLISGVTGQLTFHSKPAHTTACQANLS